MQSPVLTAIADAIQRHFPGTDRDSIRFEGELEVTRALGASEAGGTWVAFRICDASGLSSVEGAAFARPPQVGGDPEAQVDVFVKKMAEVARGESSTHLPDSF